MIISRTEVTYECDVCDGRNRTTHVVVVKDKGEGGEYLLPEGWLHGKTSPSDLNDTYIEICPKCAETTGLAQAIRDRGQPA